MFPFQLKKIQKICPLLFPGIFFVFCGFLILSVAGSLYEDETRPAFLNNFLVEHIVAERERVKGKAQAVYLNHYKPSFDNVKEIIRDPKNVPTEELMKYVPYYEKLIEFLPDYPDSYAVLGFFYYYLNRTDDALAIYQRAVDLGPYIFWAWHNLGIIYYEIGEYEKAIFALKWAVQLRPEVKTKAIFSSKIYKEIIVPRKMEYLVGVGLQEGGRSAYEIIVRSCFFLKRHFGMLKMARHVLEENAFENRIFYYYAGVASFYLKDYANAIKFLKQYIGHRVEQADAYQYLGLALQALNKKNEARNAFGQARRLGWMDQDLGLFQPELLGVKLF
ncbi:MAG: tetratricopeptide repeat protein [Candidatus Omnitrophica bacterium]|nr:tetratricopeptide repeat protein [Candidatus Omnitrophota bacterium]